MLYAQEKIEVAINCMHYKATHYVIKNETAFLQIQKAIANMFRLKKREVI